MRRAALTLTAAALACTALPTTAEDAVDAYLAKGRLPARDIDCAARGERLGP